LFTSNSVPSAGIVSKVHIRPERLHPILSVYLVHMSLVPAPDSLQSVRQSNSEFQRHRETLQSQVDALKKELNQVVDAWRARTREQESERAIESDSLQCLARSCAASFQKIRTIYALLTLDEARAFDPSCLTDQNLYAPPLDDCSISSAERRTKA
jgi:hypothetical protein